MFLRRPGLIRRCYLNELVIVVGADPFAICISVVRYREYRV